MIHWKGDFKTRERLIASKGLKVTIEPNIDFDNENVIE